METLADAVGCLGCEAQGTGLNPLSIKRRLAFVYSSCHLMGIYIGMRLGDPTCYMKTLWWRGVRHGEIDAKRTWRLAQDEFSYNFLRHSQYVGSGGPGFKHPK
jgi:hypothetical protein